MLSYNRGILYSKAICDFLSDDENLIRDYDIHVETFNNCRESGYCLSVHYYEKHEEGKYFSTFYIWIHENRNGEECVVRWGDDKDFLPEELNFTNMYSEKIYAKQSKYFYPFSPYEIADFIAEKIKAHFNGQE